MISDGKAFATRPLSDPSVVPDSEQVTGESFWRARHGHGVSTWPSGHQGLIDFGIDRSGSEGPRMSPL